MFMLQKYRKILTNHNWCLESGALSNAQQEWLLHQGSLTQKLLQVTQQFNVEITQQKWITKKVKNLTASSKDYWLREVLLKEKDQAWIFAQTLVPKATIDNVAKDLPTLGNQAIGLWLFPQQPERISLEWQFDKESKMYMRKARYVLKGYPLEIYELFLKDFPYL
ncbi:chorismate--pyruvate lyase family protein [Actinobacillus arthritidis]|uniref:chorismate--pyruvate lyase family protein n=1 Tax=Actinobacillus arthritidis TaxID=157339 RepID=UPI0024419DDE|nr:chorismate lyase [Actinobacillus arthritidis]WGE90242.1 chorismate lyase [Actinobacillus arthritidis]